MAIGYACARPSVHPEILARAAVHCRLPVGRLLDLGCGAGVSLRPLDSWAKLRVGVEPVAAMLPAVRTVAPGCPAVAGRAEALPFPDAVFDLVTAAGSLNFAPVEEALAEVHRVLTAEGRLLVYDFAAGRSFPDSGALGDWFTEFRRRYPRPVSEAVRLDPEVLATRARQFKPGPHETVAIELTLSPEFYLDYMMTETNVAAAVRGGTAIEEVRAWCAGSLAEFWTAPRAVVFEGYWALLDRA